MMADLFIWMAFDQYAFSVLRPICTSLIKPGVQRDIQCDQLSKLESALQSLSAESLQSCRDYVLFPLTLLIEQNKKSSGTAQAWQLSDDGHGSILSRKIVDNDQWEQWGCLKYFGHSNPVSI